MINFARSGHRPSPGHGGPAIPCPNMGCMKLEHVYSKDADPIRGHASSKHAPDGMTLGDLLEMMKDAGADEAQQWILLYAMTATDIPDRVWDAVDREVGGL